MKLAFDRSVTNDLDLASQREWLEPNGLGGWASSSIIGMNTRRYHGLLVAALNPPGRRMVLVSKVDESLLVHDRRYELGCNSYPGIIHPNGDQYLESFSLDLVPTFLYEAGGIRLTKKVVAIHGENTTLVLYDIEHAPGPFILELQPIIAGRDYHQLMIQNDQISPDAEFGEGTLRVQPYTATPPIHIHLAGAQFHHHPDWYYQFEYHEEQLRGLECQEDLFSYGSLRIEVNPGDAVGLILSTEMPRDRNPFDLYEAECRRRTALLKPFAKASPEMRRLMLSSDAFIVARGKDKSVLAGYPWFTDRGRDTLASITGLCLTTRRHREAKAILRELLSHLHHGLLPGVYLESGDPPLDDVADTSLWLAPAAHDYWKQTGDVDFALTVLYPALTGIMDAMTQGTRHGFHVDTDHLLSSGTTEEQVSWMNIRIDDVAITPRHGKTVEGNALWHQLLNLTAELAEAAGKQDHAKQLRKRCAAHRRQFAEQFWNEAGQCLFDVIDPAGDKHSAIRPHQILAIGLAIPLLETEQARAVLATLRRHLFLPCGLRSLSPSDEGYQPVMDHELISQDRVLHQGPARFQFLYATVQAMRRFGTAEETASTLRTVRHFVRRHLEETGLGHVSEVFDATVPHTAHGATAFAWNTAELIRVLADEEGL